MNLTAQGIRLRLTPISKADSEDWARLRVLATVNGFEADFFASAQSLDIEQFQNQLAKMHGTLAPGSEAALAPIEPGIRLLLTMRSLGQVSGTYRLESEVRDEAATVLSGSFELDQSFLPTLLLEAKALLEQLRAQNAA